MATEAIAARYALLQQGGVNLGAPQGDEQEAGHGGRFQTYERGRIYWHQTTGAYEVHGRLLEQYLSGGGPDVNPGTGEREMGFPTSGHTRPDDGRYECVTFQWGTLADVSGTAIVRLFGRLYKAWRAEGGAIGRLGHPLDNVAPVEGGRAAWFERGVLWHADGSADVLVGELVPPTLGRPALVNPDAPGAFEWMRFDGALAALDARPGLAGALMANRLSLVPVGGVMDTRAELDAHPERTAAPAAAVGGGGIIDLVPGAVTARDDGRWLSFSVPMPNPRMARFAHLRETFNAGLLGHARTTLERRRLYSLAFRTPGLPPRTISPHCLYARSDWDRFGVAHITDLHLSRRIEHYRAKLRATGVLEEDVARLNNWNDAFRDFIRYANHLHAAGLLDVIMATGDLVDYVREVDDHPAGPGNFGFFEALVRGEAHSPDAQSPPSEALRVPVFTSLGNHDYRRLPYALGFKLNVRSSDVVGMIPVVGGLLKSAMDGVDSALSNTPGLGVVTKLDAVAYASSKRDVMWMHTGLNTTHDEAERLMGLTADGQTYHVPALRPEDAAPAVQVEPAMRDGTHYYFRYLNPERSYVVQLGTHRLVMLETRWDLGITDEVSEALLTKLGFGTESQENFVAVNPDSVGITAKELEKLRGALHDPGAEGVVVVGMHAPPLNPHGNDFSNFLRESVHPTADAAQALGFLARHARSEFVRERREGAVQFPPQPAPDADRKRPGWPRTGTSYFHTGPVEDLLDYGIAVGQQEALAQLIAGQGAPRPATMVCCGHGHYRIEYRLRWNADTTQLEAYTDHYLANPDVYYATRLVEGDWWKTDAHKRYHVRVQEGAPAGGAVQTIHDNRGTIWPDLSELRVPPYPTPLAGATDAAAWWRAHSPVVVQTGAMGPCVNTRATLKVNEVRPEPNFQGFRLMEIAGNVIARAHYITMPELRGASFPLPWEGGNTEQPGAGESNATLLLGLNWVVVPPQQPGTPPPSPAPAEVTRTP